MYQKNLARITDHFELQLFCPSLVHSYFTVGLLLCESFVPDDEGLDFLLMISSFSSFLFQTSTTIAIAISRGPSIAPTTAPAVAPSLIPLSVDGGAVVGMSSA